MGWNQGDEGRKDEDEGVDRGRELLIFTHGNDRNTLKRRELLG